MYLTFHDVWVKMLQIKITKSITMDRVDYLLWILFLYGVKAWTQNVFYARTLQNPGTTFSSSAPSQLKFGRILSKVYCRTCSLQNGLILRFCSLIGTGRDTSCSASVMPSKPLSTRCGENVIGAGMENHHYPLKL